MFVFDRLLVDFFFLFFTTTTQVSADSANAGYYSLWSIVVYLHRIINLSYSIMPAYTVAIVRSFVDDLDSIFRDGVKNGNIKEVYLREKNAVVSFRFPILKF